MVAEEQYEIEVHKQRVSTNPPQKPISSRLVGIKPSNPSYKRESYPASADSFVVLPSKDISPPSTATTTTPTTSTPLATSLQPVSNVPVEDPNWSRNNTLSHRLRVASRLFDIMSSKSSVDHPMCQECTDMLLESLERQMSDVGRERDAYIEFLKKVKDNRVTKKEEEELVKQVEEVC